MSIKKIEEEGITQNLGFTHTMPISILALYRSIMSQMAKRGMQIAVAIVKDRGVYNFSFIDKKGKELYRMIFFRGIDSPDKIMKYKNMALLPYSVRTREDLVGLEWEIDECLSCMEVPHTIHERIERFLQFKI